MSWDYGIFVLCKFILKICLHSHPMRLYVWFLVRLIIYFHTSCVRTAKALERLRGCAGTDVQARLCLRCRLCDKYHNLMSWLNYQFRYPYCNANIHTIFINHIILHFYKPHHLVPKVSIKTRMLAKGKWCNVIPTVYCTTYVSNSLILIQVTVSLHSGVNQKWISLVISSHIRVIVRKIFQSFQTSSTPSFYTKQVNRL